ncbi:citrate lyase subunit alpha [Salmonella enterica subsp. enterica]|uniref:Citrate lyase subunit alpha n=1 Tax=Salmonella enterica I TaxID=59201 RepID=A0A3S5DM21_SALET|nr:citrate lyase subunit alpha [Salmonella enterica subsp. enterica]
MSLSSACRAAMNLVMLTALAASHAAALWGMRRLMRSTLKCVVLLTEEWVEFPNYPASIAQESG